MHSRKCCRKTVFDLEFNWEVADQSALEQRRKEYLSISVEFEVSVFFVLYYIGIENTTYFKFNV